MKDFEMPKRKPGRPKLPRGWKKSRILPIRFTDDDIKAIAARATEKKQSVSEWIRNTITAALQDSAPSAQK
jgi:predicted HicB family RNase H-like nuclease